ncbi:odontogenic ameloblast-associated protein isoform X1 [Loxodonta africana]|uniref:odontogenic ameloblast-associated protein isoform X1 n=1 Tax=Loxodonta africana TaxID=9785 RepID=UPI0030D11DD6
MKVIILLGLLGATLAAPLVPQRLVSASNSNELLLNLNNARLLPLQFQGPFNSLTPPFSGILQHRQQAQAPGLSQVSLPTLDQFVGLFPNQVPFPGQANFAQGPQWAQLDPSQAQIPLQTQQGPNHVMPYVVSFKLPQEQAQTLQYYPLYVYLPWEQALQTVTSTQLPQQAGQQQIEVQVPLYTLFEYIPQQAEPVIPGGQQQVAFEPLVGTAPEIALLPAGEVVPYLQKEMTNFRHASAGIYRPSTSPKPSTTHFFTSAVDPTITPEFMEEKAKTDSLREP